MVAEEIVARHLRALGRRGNIVLNGLQSRYGDIDHLVFQKDGRVVMIETKSHVGTVTSDGDRLLINGRPLPVNPLCQIHCNIRWLRRKLKQGGRQRVWCVAVLALPYATVKVRRPFKRVIVLGSRQIDQLSRLLR